MTKGKVEKVFTIHLGITLALGLMLVPLGGVMFERHPPDGWSYLVWSVYGLIGFPVLDVTLIKITHGREIGDVLGAFWLLLIPINSVAAAVLMLVGDRFRQTVLRKYKRVIVK